MSGGLADTMPGAGLRWLPPLGVLVVIAGFSAVAAIPAPFTWPARIATAAAILALLWLAVRRGWHRPGAVAGAVPPAPAPPAPAPAAPSTPTASPAPAASPEPEEPADSRPGSHRIAIAVWVVLIAVAVALQLGNFWSDPREVYPTLSSLLEDPLSSYPGRAVGYAVWLWLGWYLVQR